MNSWTPSHAPGTMMSFLLKQTGPKSPKIEPTETMNKNKTFLAYDASARHVSHVDKWSLIYSFTTHVNKANIR